MGAVIEADAVARRTVAAERRRANRLSAFHSLSGAPHSSKLFLGQIFPLERKSSS
jgi:hypothetical protein